MGSIYDSAEIYDLIENDERYNAYKKHWENLLEGKKIESMLDISITDKGMTYLRKTNPASFSEYRNMVLENHLIPDSEYINPSESRFETMMLGLRMNKGVSDETFRKMHGLSVRESFGPRLVKMMDAGLLLHEKGYWKMTRRGQDIQNMLLVELLVD